MITGDDTRDDTEENPTDFITENSLREPLETFQRKVLGLASNKDSNRIILFDEADGHRH